MLPYLTYLTIFSYSVTAEGEIINIDDTEIIKIAKEYGAAPIIMLTGLANNQTEEINVTHNDLLSQVKQEQFFNNLLIFLKAKGYYGVNINTPYIYPQDRNLYVDFITRFANRVNSEGFKVYNTISLSAFEITTGTIYKGLEYARIGQAVNGTVLISYEWGYATGIPSNIVSYNTIGNLLGYLLEKIPSEEVSIGVNTIGYVFKLPYEVGVFRGQSISYNSAIELASAFGSEIQYDDTTMSAYFQYISTKTDYIVWFRDARSINDIVKIIQKFNLEVIAVWNIMIDFPQMWPVINSRYEIEKIDIKIES